MNLIQLNAAKDLFQRELKRLDAVPVNCTSCEHHQNQRCKKWDSIPPPEVKVAGCEDWQYDWIPF